jgi:hypothetical protein
MSGGIFQEDRAAEICKSFAQGLNQFGLVNAAIANGEMTYFVPFPDTRLDQDTVTIAGTDEHLVSPVATGNEDALQSINPGQVKPDCRGGNALPPNSPRPGTHKEGPIEAAEEFISLNLIKNDNDG